MKVVIKTSPMNALAVAKSMVQAIEEREYTYGADVRELASVHVIGEGTIRTMEYNTCGGNIYRISTNGVLMFQGSRRSFDMGALWGRIELGGIYLCDQEERLRYKLLEWESTLPGNPSPFADWLGILHVLEEQEAVERREDELLGMAEVYLNRM